MSNLISLYDTYLDEQLLPVSGDLGERPADELCLLNCDLRPGLFSRSWFRSGDKWDLDSRRPLDALSGLKLSRRARLSDKSPSGLKAGCEPLRLPETGKQDSSKAVACRCKRCNLGRSGLARESRLWTTRPHCVVESRLPFGGAVGLVAGGVTELIIIVGGGSAWHPVSVCVVTNNWPGHDSLELFDGRCSCRKFGSSDTTNESLFFFVAPTIFGKPFPNNESRRPLRFDSPESRRESLRLLSNVPFAETSLRLPLPSREGQARRWNS